MRSTIAVIIALALAGAGGYLISSQLDPSRGPSATPVVVKEVPWIAAALGRVEPRSGEVRIGAGVLGRVLEVPVKENDKVEEGELLVRLDDEEARANLAAAESESGAAKNERDKESATSGREDVRKAEDAVFSAERAVTGARFELDTAIAGKRSGSGSERALEDARRRLKDAKDRLTRELQAFARAQSKSNVPAPSRLESGVNSSRAKVNIAEALLDKTRIRAPMDGTVLQMNAKLGEMVAPSPEQPLVVIGDMSVVRVKAEVDEGDVAKVRKDQRAFVRSNSYPGRDFDGKVTRIAPSLAAPRLTARGPRRSTDVQVMEVTVELDGSVPLLPGMRVDTFFRREP